MTVAELIETLRALPSGAEVSVGAEFGPGQLAPAELVQVVGRKVVITGAEQACPHPVGQRGWIQSVDGPVAVCGQCCGVVV